ncbi:Uu.00g045530.m01.CDS01 [Anthostomella pinea]|uniref:Uu.00g045530.m01.CDS01 n=1 Tax=Anthostomella pinea TaxID=933095 RepID=A0AAI8VC46_9PEZI|nr:Uu.00g045530.m01.CDS01 [Anthostomella pinea]
MTKGEASQAKVHYKGSEEDYIVFVDDVETFRKWTEDKSVPMAHFISSFKIFVTHKQGTQGQLDGASDQLLDNEFKTHVVEEVIPKILEKGDLQTTTGPGRQAQGGKSESKMTNLVGGQPTH